VGYFATVHEDEDLQFRGVFAQESARLGLKPVNGVLVLERWEVARIFAHCHGRTQQMNANDFYRMFLVKMWLDSGEAKLLFA
jgi:hypothetical protein